MTNLTKSEKVALMFVTLGFDDFLISTSDTGYKVSLKRGGSKVNA